MTKKLETYAYPKLTLHLKVEKELRDDGYHNVQILSIPLNNPSNTISIEENDSWSKSKNKINIKTDCSDIPIGEKSLVWRAANLLVENFPNTIPPMNIHVKEEIPISAGLGGGSADAAAVMKGINELFDLGMSKEQLAVFSMTPDKNGNILGSDIPLCIYNHPSIVKGKGDIITPINLFIKNDILLIVPTVREKENKTSIVYKSFDENKQSQLMLHDVEDVLILKNKSEYIIDYKKLGNSFISLPIDFLQQSFEMINDLGMIQGVIYAGLAGAGPTVFFILDNQRPDNAIYSIRTYLSNRDAQVIHTRQLREII
ncbi:hypothetical protein J7J26_01995 [Candidatus Micrarchaeota archaeon]|nr:hypothetical protein [Candidatus Micrarchaeota archaeon]